jgi:hypothetical protein
MKQDSRETPRHMLRPAGRYSRTTTVTANRRSRRAPSLDLITEAIGGFLQATPEANSLSKALSTFMCTHPARALGTRSALPQS